MSIECNLCNESYNKEDLPFFCDKCEEYVCQDCVGEIVYCGGCEAHICVEDESFACDECNGQFCIECRAWKCDFADHSFCDWCWPSVRNRSISDITCIECVYQLQS